MDINLTMDIINYNGAFDRKTKESHASNQKWIPMHQVRLSFEYHMQKL